MVRVVSASVEAETRYDHVTKMTKQVERNERMKRKWRKKMEHIGYARNLAVGMENEIVACMAAAGVGEDSVGKMNSVAMYVSEMDAQVGVSMIEGVVGNSGEVELEHAVVDLTVVAYTNAEGKRCNFEVAERCFRRVLR